MYVIEEHAQPDRIVIKNFLPTPALADLFDELDALEPHFGQPAWSKGYEEALCRGTDIWLPKAGVDAPWLQDEFRRYLFHMGVRTYLENARSELFRLIPRMAISGMLHAVNYRDGGYYNWHADNEVAFPDGTRKLGHTTWNLTIARDPDSAFEGGDLLLRHRDTFVRVPFVHNQLTIFGAHTYHAVTEVQMMPGADFMDGRFSVQFWLAGGDVANYG